MTERDISGNEDRANALGSAVSTAKCDACRGTRFVAAPDDNAWRLYFRRTNQGVLAQNVLVPCPDCYGKVPAAQSKSSEAAVLQSSSPEAGGE